MKKRLWSVLLALSLVLGVSMVPALAEDAKVWDGKTYTQPQKADGFYQIGTPAELMWWNQNGSSYSNARLTADIRLNRDGDTTNLWPVMCGGKEDNAFEGELDGGGYSILGLCIRQENTLHYEMGSSGPNEFADRTAEVGLFGYTNGAKIHDLGLEGQIYVLDRPISEQGDWLQVGGLVGYAKSRTMIDRCWTNLAMTVDFSTDTWTEAGCALSGHPEACDVSVGGLAGTVQTGYSGNAKISNCYSRGSCLVVGGRSTNVGGIAGSGRPYQSSWSDPTRPELENCWSSMAIEVFDKGMTYPGLDSHLGGILGDTAFTDENGPDVSAVRNCAALNPSIQGLGAEKGYHAGPVCGKNAETVENSQSLDGMTITGAAADGAAGQVKTAESITFDTWDSTIWDMSKGRPQLKNMTGQDTEDRVAEYVPQVYPADREWDGYVSDVSVPPYLNLWCETAGHNRRLVKKFPAAELKALAAQNTTPITYSVNDLYAENSVLITTDSYIPLTALMESADARFGAADELLLAARNSRSVLKINQPWLMEAPRFFYDYSNPGSEGIPVPTVLALCSRSGAYRGDTGSRSSALLFGQQNETDQETGSYMMEDGYGCTGIMDMTILYPAEEAMCDTVRTLLLTAVERAEADALSQSGPYGEALASARQVCDGGSNLDAFAAMDQLEQAERTAHRG